MIASSSKGYSLYRVQRRAARAGVAAMERERVTPGVLFKDLYELREDLGKYVVMKLDLFFPSLCKSFSSECSA